MVYKERNLEQKAPQFEDKMGYKDLIRTKTHLIRFGSYSLLLWWGHYAFPVKSLTWFWLVSYSIN